MSLSPEQTIELGLDVFETIADQTEGPNDAINVVLAVIAAVADNSADGRFVLQVMHDRLVELASLDDDDEDEVPASFKQAEWEALVAEGEELANNPAIQADPVLSAAVALGREFLRNNPPR